MPKKSIFWAKYGRFWAKFGRFGAKFGRFWTQSPNFTGGSKSFGTHVMEKPPRDLVFWPGMGLNGPKMPIFGPK